MIKQNAIKGKWISTSADDDSEKKSYPDSIIFKHHPDFEFFCSKNNDCEWINGQQNNSWNPFKSKNLYEAKYTITAVNQIQIEAGDTTFQYLFQLLPDNILQLQNEDVLIEYVKSIDE